MDDFDDIRAQLRGDHVATLAELDALRGAVDGPGARARLQKLRRAWVTHALAEETVVYRTLDGVQVTSSPSDASMRFVEHRRADRHFEKVLHHRAGTRDWIDALDALRDFIARHVAAEQEDTFMRLAGRFDRRGLCEMGRRFQLARTKLRMLEDAKAA
ncbi:MAG: hemerythrin domain-containing protein [Usitatibacter sp.]